MSKFIIQDGQFWLDGQPVLIQAGEFHYFRTPRDQWRQRLELLQAAGFNAVASYIPWLWHQLEEDVSDFDGRSHPMRDLAGFLDLAADMGLYIIPRPGPYIMAETTNEGIPPWVFEHYPSAAFINQTGAAENFVSYLHPDFLTCARKWYQAVFAVLAPRQITRGGRILMIQLDNEMGMIQWVRNIVDVNPDTLARFSAHLHKAYGQSLAARYPTDNLTALLQDSLMHPAGAYAASVLEDYRRFYRDYLREYAEYLWSEAKACGLEVPPVINIHGFMNGGKTFPIGHSQLLQVMSIDGMISATDVYPGLIGEGNFAQLLLVNEMTKPLMNRQQPLFSMEFQAGGNQDFGSGQSSLYDLHSRLSISCGMRGINHYLFFDGENDPVLSSTRRHDWGHPVRKDGTLRSHYHRYPKLSQALAAYGQDLTLSEPQAVTAIGFLLDTYMTEVSNAATREAVAVHTHQREMILFDFIARGLALTHRAFTALDLDRETLDPARTPLCWVAMEKQCSAATQQKLVDYVQKGGKLILVGRMCVEDFYHQPCTTLVDALGIRINDTRPPLEEFEIDAFAAKNIPVTFLETYTGSFAETFAKTKDGETVGFIQPFGEGQWMVLGAAFPANSLDDIEVVNQMALKMGLAPQFSASAWADIRISRGEQGAFLFVNNYQDDPVTTTLRMDQQLLFGGSPLTIPARSGLILPLDWHLNPDVTLNYSTSEIVAREILPDTIRLKTAAAEFTAELTLSGYVCDQASTVVRTGEPQRIRVTGNGGELVLRRV